MELYDSDAWTWPEKNPDEKFTGAIMTFSDGDFEIFDPELLGKFSSVLMKSLHPGAAIIVESNIKFQNMMTNAFEKSGFEAWPPVIQITETGYRPWLVFTVPGAETVLDYDELVIRKVEAPIDEMTILRSQDIKPQKVMRALIKLICPNPKRARILLPNCEPEAGAACKALKIKSVGYRMGKDCPDLKTLINKLSKIEVDDETIFIS